MVAQDLQLVPSTGYMRGKDVAYEWTGELRVSAPLATVSR